MELAPATVHELRDRGMPEWWHYCSLHATKAHEVPVAEESGASHVPGVCVSSFHHFMTFIYNYNILYLYIHVDLYALCIREYPPYSERSGANKTWHFKRDNERVLR